MRLKSMGHAPKEIWVPAAMTVLFLTWLVLFFLGMTTTAVELVRPFFPSWIVTVNLVALPVLAFITAASLPIPAEIRLVSGGLALCSLSAMHLAYNVHPVAYTLTLAFLVAEAFVAIPLWNKYRHRKLGVTGGGSAETSVKRRALAYMAYLLVGLAIAAYLVYAIVSRH